MKQLVTIETDGQYARVVTLQYGQWYSKEELEEIKAHNMPIIEMASGTGRGSLLQQMIEAIEKGDDRPWWQNESDTPWWQDTTRRVKRDGD